MRHYFFEHTHVHYAVVADQIRRGSVVLQTTANLATGVTKTCQSPRLYGESFRALKTKERFNKPTRNSMFLVYHCFIVEHLSTEVVKELSSRAIPVPPLLRQLHSLPFLFSEHRPITYGGL